MKKKMQWNLEWATTHYGVESRYNALYRDRQGWKARNRRAWPGRLGHDMARKGATTQCNWAATRQPARQEFLHHDTGFVSRQGRGSTCLGLAPVMSRYSFCIVTGRRLG